MSATLENAERKLDAMAADALRLEAERLDREHLDAAERARRMMTARAVVRAWRERATGAALRDAQHGAAR